MKPQGGKHVGPFPGAIGLAIILAGCAGQAARPPAGDAKTPNPRDEMRMPWSAASEGYLRSWLVLGEFPNPPHEGAQAYDHTPPCVGLDTDYLKEHGGEPAIRPAAGMTHKRPDGTVARWAAVDSREDIVDFVKCFTGRPTENVVAYAWTALTSPKERQAVLAVGSDDGVRIWLNGKRVHDLLAARAVTPDQDLVPVTLRAGENTILVKVEQGAGGWGFCLRVLSPEQAGGLRGGQISPSIVATSDAGTLEVKTDGASPPPGAEAAAVKVEVVGPGGVVVAAEQAPRGQTVRLAARDWPDGPYEVRCTTITPLGRRDVKHLPWYKGDAAVAARRLVETAAKADRSTPEGMVHAMLAEMILDRAGPSLDKVGPDAWPRFHSPLMESAELEQLGPGAKGEGKGPVRPYGFVRLAYRDDIDDSPQFCRCYLPADYDPAKRWPLVVNLHGYNPPNPPYVRWWSVDQRHHPSADIHNVIEIEPLGRYNTSYLGIGDRDVMRCVEMAKRRFNIDEDRVYLMGYSMGGGGTWHVGTRHTDVFAAIAPIYGGWDYHIWLDEKAWPKLTDARRLRFERESSFVSAEALLTTPVFVNHGDADELVNVDFSRYVVRMLQRWGYHLRYWEHPGKGHGALGCEDALMEWFLAHPRQNHPRQVRLRAPDLASARAQWVAVTARQDPLNLIRADVEILGPNFIRLDTDSAAEVVLTPGGPLIDPAKPVKVIWNGTDVRQVMLKDGRLSLQALGTVAAPLVKRPGLEGPLSTATQKPFAVVVGTISPDPMMRRLCERIAGNFAAGWEKWQHARPRFYKDTEISKDDMARYTLLLAGGPDANAVTKALADRLPVKIAGDEVVVDGRRFKAPDSAVQFIYPNPLNAERMVVVQAGTSAKGMFMADRLPDDVDFVIADARAADRDAGRPEEKVVIAAGFFDSTWRLTESHMDTGDPAIRAKCPLRKVPVYPTASVKAPRLMLSDALDAKAEGSFINMQRDLNWRGKPIWLGGRMYASGLGVECQHETCAAEWDLAGAGWRRIRATIGIEIKDPAKLEPRQKDNTRVVFIVKGDGKELFRSKPFRWDARPAELDVDVTGIKVLRLEVANETTWFCAASSVDWADVRLER